MSGPQPSQRRRIGKGPFRGGTGKGVYQTGDLGTGNAANIVWKAQRYPNRKYVAMDRNYDLQLGGKFYREKFKNTGIVMRGGIIKTLGQMIEQKVRFRHLNMDMPFPWSRAYGRAGARTFDILLDLIPHVLLPNGHLFVSSEEKETLNQMKTKAEAKGYKARFIASRSDYQDKHRTEAIRYYKNDPHTPIHRLRITFGLKKAIPDKAKRKAWPE